MMLAWEQNDSLVDLQGGKNPNHLGSIPPSL